MTCGQYAFDDSTLTKREKFTIGAVLFLVAALTAFDVFEDLIEGASPTHIIFEVTIIVLLVGVGLYIFRSALKHRKVMLSETREEFDRVKREATNWRSKAESLGQGISDAISGQLDDWGLTPAENDICFLLLKGLTIHEIAEIRETTERTVRQQASEIYKKSGLTGRAQLSAFFMEDLFER